MKISIILAVLLMSGCASTSPTKYDNPNARYDKSGEPRQMTKAEICRTYPTATKVIWYGREFDCRKENS